MIPDYLAWSFPPRGAQSGNRVTAFAECREMHNAEMTAQLRLAVMYGWIAAQQKIPMRKAMNDFHKGAAK